MRSSYSIVTIRCRRSKDEFSKLSMIEWTSSSRTILELLLDEHQNLCVRHSRHLWVNMPNIVVRDITRCAFLLSIGVRGRVDVMFEMFGSGLVPGVDS